MWKNNSPSLADDNAIVQNVDSKVAASSFIAKRQRRSNVRLEELGDGHDSSLPPHDVSSPGNFQENLQSSDFKSPYCRPGAHAKNDGHLKGPVVAKVSSKALDLQDTDTPHKKNGDQMQQLLTSKSGRGGRVPRVPRPANSVKKFVSVSQSGTLLRANHKEKVPCMQAAKGMRSGKEKNADSSVDFIASAHQNTSSTSDESGQDGVRAVHDQRDNKVRDYLPAQAQAMRGRTNRRVQASSRIVQAFETMDDGGAKLSAQAIGSVRSPRGKLVVAKRGRFQEMQKRLLLEGNVGGDIMEHGDGRRLYIENHSHPSIGIREWLQSLGLGKYTELFETHEVELDVLPLLTFEDLREMGVFAVGSRRKIFSAIQQFRKIVLPEVM